MFAKQSQVKWSSLRHVNILYMHSPITNAHTFKKYILANIYIKINTVCTPLCTCRHKQQGENFEPSYLGIQHQHQLWGLHRTHIHMHKHMLIHVHIHTHTLTITHIHTYRHVDTHKNAHTYTTAFNRYTHPHTIM